MSKALRYFLPIFFILTGLCNHASASRNSFDYLSSKNLSNTEQISSIQTAQKASSVSVISYHTEKLNRILNDSFIEKEEEVKDHEDDDVISLEIFLDSNIHLASLAATRTLPPSKHFFYFASERYLVFQTFRI